jgi:hypothetical protein
MMVILPPVGRQEVLDGQEPTEGRRKLVEFDAPTWHALNLLSRESMKSFQELAHELKFAASSPGNLGDHECILQTNGRVRTGIAVGQQMDQAFFSHQPGLLRRYFRHQNGSCSNIPPWSETRSIPSRQSIDIPTKHLACNPPLRDQIRLSRDPSA